MYQPLSEFLKSRTQQEAAKMLGCSQGYISQTLKSNRAVFVKVHSKTVASAFEIRPFAVNRDPSSSEVDRLHRLGRRVSA
jgi:predicted transcriptional regulator